MGSKPKDAKRDFVSLLESYSLLISVALLIVVLAGAVYLRLVPAKIYGFSYLNGNDPWIEYWLAVYLYHHNLGGLSGLEDVKFWWYPWGRDFLISEYLGFSLISAFLSQHFHVSLTESLGLEPVIFAAFGVVGTYLAVLNLSRSKLGAIAAASVYAFYPVILLDKNFATYPGKQTAGLAIISWALYLLSVAYYSRSRARALAAAVGAGLVGGSLAWIWGGYQYFTVILASLMLVEPFLVAPTNERLLRYVGATVGYAAMLTTSPAVGVRYFTHDLGLGLVALLVIYALEANIGRLHLSKIRLTETFSWRVHLWVVVLIVGLLVAAATSGIISLPSRVLLALGITPLTGVVPLTVAEYEALPFSQAMGEYGALLLVSLIGFVVLLYDLYRRRGSLEQADVAKLVTFILGFLFVVASLNEAYFAPSAAFFLAVASGSAIGVLTSMKVAHYDRRSRRTYYKPNYTALAAAALLAVVVLGVAAYYVPRDYQAMALEAPAVETSWLSAMTVPTASGGTKVLVPINNAWLEALQYVKDHTPNNSVVVSWWDYGYWIGALGNRTTVDDGSTLNGTQISLVANAFTAPVNQSGTYLRMLRLPPNYTYVLTYELFVGIYTNSTRSVMMFPYPNVIAVNPMAGVYVITYGLADMAKSYQMLRIAQRVDPYASSPFFSQYTSVSVYGNYEFYEFPGLVGGPQQNVSTVLNATIYDLMLYGISQLRQYGVFGEGAAWLESATNFVPAGVSYVDPTTGAVVPQSVSPPSPEPYYEPVAFFVSVPYAWSPSGSNVTYFYAVVVFLYRWTGLP